MSTGAGLPFFQKRHPKGQEVHERLLAITHRQGDANRPTVRRPLAPV